MGGRQGVGEELRLEPWLPTLFIFSGPGVFERDCLRNSVHSAIKKIKLPVYATTWRTSETLCWMKSASLWRVYTISFIRSSRIGETKVRKNHTRTCLWGRLGRGLTGRRHKRTSRMVVILVEDCGYICQNSLNENSTRKMCPFFICISYQKQQEPLTNTELWLMSYMLMC